MIYIIMCGGDYEWEKPLTEIDGETLVNRTIRLLMEHGVRKSNIYISTDTKRVSMYAPYGNVIPNDTGFSYTEHKGSWLTAYVPTDVQVTYLHGDVFYTEDAINMIVNILSFHPEWCDQNIFIGNHVALNRQHKRMGEPFGWIVFDPSKFRLKLAELRMLESQGKIQNPFSWHLYQIMNGKNIHHFDIDVNYLCISDGTIDLDAKWQIPILESKVKKHEI